MEKERARIRIGGHRANSKSSFALVDIDQVERVKRYRWSRHSNGYACRFAEVAPGKMGYVYLHRFLLGLGYGDGRVVDHRNGNPLDCRMENMLVLENNGENLQNRVKRKGSSLFRGVVKTPSGKWKAGVSSNGVRYNIGTFDREITAALHAEAARRQLMPYALPDKRLERRLGEDLDLLVEDIRPNLQGVLFA